MQALTLLLGVEVPPRLLEGIAGGEKLDLLKLPKPEKSGVFAVGGGEEHVGVEEEPIHVEALGLGPFVRDRVGIEAHLPDFLTDPLIILTIQGVLEEKLRAAFLGVHLDGQRDRRPEQEALGGFLNQDLPSHFKAIALSKRSWDHDGSPFSDSRNLRHF